MQSEKNMSDSGEELSPEQQNISNRNKDGNTDQTLQAILKKPQQSYENFVSCFTHLKLEDIEKNKQSQKKNQVNMQKDTGIPIQRPSKCEYVSKPTEVVRVDTDELEEEVLEEFPNKSSPKVPRKKMAQFGNFLTEEGSDNDEDYDATKSEYCASFNTRDLKFETKQSLKPKCADDRILPETTVQDAKNLEVHTCVAPICDNSETLLNSQELISRSLKVNNTPDVSSQTVVHQCGPYQPDETGYLLNPGEVEQELSVSEQPVVLNTTCLDYSCTVGSGANKPVVNTDVICQINSDEVKPFALDEEFDYDNVILTPKFTTVELEYLNSIDKFTSNSNDET